MRTASLVCFVAAACGSSTNTQVDGAIGHDAATTGADASRDGSTSNPDAAMTGSGTSTSHVLFLQFEGQTVNPGADDPVANTSSEVVSTVTLGKFEPGAANRAADIAAIVADLTHVLAPFHFDVVTTRPTSGAYDMVIISSDSASKIGLPTSSVGAVPVTCASQGAPTLGFLFATGLTMHTIAAYSLAMAAQQHGIPFSKVANDCMCYADAACTFSAACTIGGAGTAIDSTDYPCGPTGTMNEQALFLAAYGPH